MTLFAPHSRRFSRALLMSVVVFLPFAASLSSASFAQSYGVDSSTARFQQTALLLRQDKTISAAQAAKIAQARHGGKVLSVERVQNGDEVHYKVKLLQDNGRVKTVMIKG